MIDKLKELLLIEELDRRQVLKLMGLTGAAVAAGGFATQLFGATKAEVLDDPPAYAFFVDLEKCDGCQLCVVACNTSHYLGTKTRPPGWTGKDLQNQWITIYEMEDPLNNSTCFFPVMCQNCQKAPCIDVCPVGASFYSEYDISLIDHQRCIGCSACMAACPYQVRVFNWETPDIEGPGDWKFGDKAPTPPPKELLPNGMLNDKGEKMSDYTWKLDTHVKGTVEKCDFCLHNAVHGALPHCASACVMDALYYGDLKEDAVTASSGDTLQVSKILKERTIYRLKEELGTETRVYYIGRRGNNGN